MFCSDEAKGLIQQIRPDLTEKHRKIISQSGRADRAIANFQRDGRNGFHDPEWQRQAREAFRKHNSGEFDEYIKWRLYQDWPELEEIDKARAEAEAAAAEEEAQEQDMEEQDAVSEEQPRIAETPKSVGSQNVENGIQQSSPRHSYMSDSQLNITDPAKFSGSGKTSMDDGQDRKTPGLVQQINRFNYHRKSEINDDEGPIMFSPFGKNADPDRWYAIKSASQTPSRGSDQQNGSHERSYEATPLDDHQRNQEQKYEKRDAMDIEGNTDELQR